MGIVTDGEYRPHEDLLAKAASLATTIWAVPVLLAVAWGGLYICNDVLSPRLSGMAYGFTLFLTFIAIFVFTGQCVYVSIKGVRRREEFHPGGIKSLKIGSVLSLTNALGAGALPSIGMAFAERFPEAMLLFPCGLLLSCGWMATTAIFIGHYRTRGLWLLVAAPVALYWPFWTVALFFGGGI